MKCTASGGWCTAADLGHRLPLWGQPKEDEDSEDYIQPALCDRARQYRMCGITKSEVQWTVDSQLGWISCYTVQLKTVQPEFDPISGAIDMHCWWSPPKTSELNSAYVISYWIFRCLYQETNIFQQHFMLLHRNSDQEQIVVWSL